MTIIWRFSFCFYEVLLVVAVLFDVVFFDSNDFIVAVAVAVVVIFECVDFVALAASVTLVADFVPAVVAAFQDAGLS